MLRATPRLWKSAPEGMMDSVKNAAKSVADTVKGGAATASKEANKAVAKDEDASIGNRMGAAKDAVGDKMNETANKASSEVNKEKAKH